MKTSESINELVIALAKAALKFGPVKQDAWNPVFKSNYATLESLISATRSALAEEGLVIMQWPVSSEPSEVRLLTALAHASGQYIEETYSMPVLEVVVKREDQRGPEIRKVTPQSIGITLTYMRRYAYGAILNLASEPDNDGNQPPPRQQPRQQQSSPHRVTRVPFEQTRKMQDESEYKQKWSETIAKLTARIMEIAQEAGYSADMAHEQIQSLAKGAPRNQHVADTWTTIQPVRMDRPYEDPSYITGDDRKRFQDNLKKVASWIKSMKSKSVEKVTEIVKEIGDEKAKPVLDEYQIPVNELYRVASLTQDQKRTLIARLSV